MNPSFSIDRVGKLLRKQALESGRIHLMSALAVMGCTAVGITFWLSINNRHEYAEGFFYVFYFVGLFVCGSYYASRSFDMLGDKAKGTSWLGLPASHLEKLVTTIIYSTIIFFVVYTTGFFLLKKIAEVYIRNVPDHVYVPMNWQVGFGEALPEFVYVFFAVQAIFLLGSVYFSRHAFIKTILAVVFILLVLSLLHKAVNDHLMAEGYIWRGFDMLYFVPDERGRVYNLPSGLAGPFLWILRLIWAPAFWTITWFRLKEKQI